MNHSSEMETWRCGPYAEGQRLDQFLAHRFAQSSRSRIQQWIREGCFLVNGKPAKKNHVLKEGESVRQVKRPELPPATIREENIPLDILYEDDSLAVIHKPKGMVVHPGHGNHSATLANALAHHFSKLSDVNGPLRPGIVHRLDKNTSGLLVVAKTDVAHHDLARQLAERTLKREYLALVWGHPEPRTGTIEAPIGRSRQNPLLKHVDSRGKPAITHYAVKEYYGVASQVAVTLETGRTHQIRVHMMHAGHSIVGDPEYQGRRIPPHCVSPEAVTTAKKLLRLLDSQALHAHRIGFKHPATGQAMAFDGAPPEEFKQAVTLLRGSVPESNG